MSELTTTAGSAPTSKPIRASTSTPLWRLALLVATAHVVLILVLSPGLYWNSGPTLEELMAEGEAAMAAQDYEKAQEVFQAVLARQPEPRPIFVKAAESHRLADRMMRMQTPAGEGDQSADQSTEVAVPDVRSPSDAAERNRPKPTDSVGDGQPERDGPSQPRPGEVPDFIPPELRLDD